MATAEEKQSSAGPLNRLFCSLTALVKTPDKEKSFKSVDTSLKNNINEAITSLGHKNLPQCLAPLTRACGALPEEGEEDTAWTFTCVCVATLLQLKPLLKGGVVVLSVQQKSVLKSAAQFLSAIGIGPLLQPGVGVPMESRCNAPVTFAKNSPKKLAYLLKGLLFLTEDKQTDIYLAFAANLLLDILAALFQLSQEDKDFRVATTKFIRAMHQPTVMRHLMMLLKPNSKTPRWFFNVTSSHLNKCLMAPNGVISTVRALHDVESEQGLGEKYAKTARIILQPDRTKNPDYYKGLGPQVLELLNSSSEEYKKVASEIVQLMHAKDKNVCLEQIFEPVCKVFKPDFGDLEGNLILEADQEKHLHSSVQNLLLLISHTKISPDCISKFFPNICAFFLAIRKMGATPVLRAQTKELISQVITQAEDPEIWHTIATLPEDCLQSLSEDSAVAQSLFANFLKRFSTVEDLQEKLLLGSLLGALAGLPSVQQEFMANPSDQMIGLLKKLLEGGNPEIMELALLLLMAIISQNENNLRKCQVLLPAIKKLRVSKNSSKEMKTIIEQIFTILATYGAVSGDTLLVEEKLSNMFREKQRIEEIPFKKAASFSGPVKLTCQQTLAEIDDDEIPIKGHGYLSLTKLIRRKAPELKGKEEELWKVGLMGIHHDDSYVYLAAINAMSALVLENLKLLLRLAESYNQKKFSITARNRIGEALLQVCKGLGEMAASQRTILLNAYLIGAKDPEPAHRASSLSNLGEACKVLGYKVSTDLQEILTCAQQMSASDPDIQVKRAATLLLSLLLQGLGTQAVNTLGSSAIDVYRTMKQLAQSRDDTLRLQAQLALEELNRGIKEGLFNPRPMEKRIFITSAPPG